MTLRNILINGIAIAGIVAAPAAAMAQSTMSERFDDPAGPHSEAEHCHDAPRFHVGAYGYHRHEAGTCDVQQMRPYFGAPQMDQYCVTIGTVRFCETPL